MTDTAPLRIGIAGLGVGADMFLRGIASESRARAVAAADTRTSAVETFVRLYGGRGYPSVEELCADPEVEVVWILTPNALHCEHTVLAADHGKHIICTKPMATTVDECGTMCDAVERNGVALLCGQTSSMYPDIQAMAEVVRSGRLGRPISINAWMSTDWLLKPRVPEELDESRGGGVVYRHGPHLIDTIRLLGDSALRSVRASVGRWMSERPCAGNFSAYLEFEDGTPATIVYNGYGYFDTSELTWNLGNRMYLQEERAVVRDALRSGNLNVEAAKEGMRFGAQVQDPTSVGGAATLGEWFGITVASCERGDVRQSPHGIFVYSDDGCTGVAVAEQSNGVADVNELFEHLRFGRPLVHSGRGALATLEVATAILESSRTHREVALTHQRQLGERK